MAQRLVEEGLLGPKELAAYCDVPISTVYRWNGDGSGPTSIRVGKHLRYRPSDVEAWLTARQTNA